MGEHEPTQITERELREAELQMTGRPPASATGLIGFVPAVPPSPVATQPSTGDSGSNGGSSVGSNPTQNSNS